MARWMRIIATLLVFSALAMACAPTGPRDSGAAAPDAAPSPLAALKRITVGTMNEQDLRPSALQGSMRVVLLMAHAGLTVRGDQRLRRPVLAEAVPSLDNGLWTVFPDGRMETTWKLRDGARWHDGVPLTAEDLLFSIEVGRDREMAAFGNQGYAAIQEVRAPDARTLTITWKEPYIDADGVLDSQPVGPLPRHLLEGAYRADKATLLDLPYWASEFVGAGPFRVRESVPGVGKLLEANADYVLGRPKIDQIDVKYIPDANTLTANLFAGTVDVTHNVGSIDHAIQLRDQWRAGTVLFNYGSDVWIVAFPQFVEPRPAALADLQVRRALAHAIDRQEIVETLVAGLSPVPHSYMSPSQSVYRDIEAALPRYDYDPLRSAQLLEARGYRKGPDGIYRDAENRRLELEVRGGPVEQTAKPATAVAGYWQQLGVATIPVRITPQQTQDQEWMATFPAFWVQTHGNDVNGLRNLLSSQARLPSNNFRVSGTGNRSRYMSAEFDALLDTYFRTVPVPERIQALGQVIHHIAEQITIFGLHYNPTPGAHSERVLHVSREWPQTYIAWNAHEWELSR